MIGYADFQNLFTQTGKSTVFSMGSVYTRRSIKALLNNNYRLR